MSLPLVFLRAARHEYDEAADYHDGRATGWGAKFVAAVQKVLDRIADQPDYYPVALDDVREAMVSGFSYCVYFRPEPKQVVVISVFHASRDPNVWQSRI